MLPLRRLEIRRHAKKDEQPGTDLLSADGIQQAYDLGRSLRVGYTHLYSSGAQRSTQTIACILAGMGRSVLNGVAVRAGLLSAREDEWRSSMRSGNPATVDDLLKSHPDLVHSESQRLGAELLSILKQLPEGGYALAIGHTPLIECGVLGLSGKTFPLLRECEGFLLTELKGGRITVDARS